MRTRDAIEANLEEIAWPEDVHNAYYGERSFMTKKLRQDATPEEGEDIGGELRELPTSSTDSSNTETAPAAPPKEQASPCVLCLWFEKRLTNTMKEHVKHMEGYHLN